MSNKPCLLIALEKFRSTHQLAGDDAYDDIVASSILYIETDYLRHYIEMADLHWADLPDETKDRIMQSFCLRVSNRLLNLSSSFTLTTDSLEQTRQIHQAVEDELDQMHRCERLLKALAENNEYVPAPAKHGDMLHDVLETVIDTSHHSVKLSSHVLELASHHAAHSASRSVADASATAAGGLQAAGLVMQGINFLLIPAIYIYYAAKREPVPFNASNNTKWALSGVGLALGLVGVLVPPAGVAILFTMAAIGLIASVAGLTAHIHDRMQTKNKLSETKALIKGYQQKLDEARSQALALKARILQHITDPYHDPRSLSEDQSQLKALHEVYGADQLAMKTAQIQQLQLVTKVHHSHSNLHAINSGFQVVLACAIIAGAVLMVTPFTAPAGLTLLIVAGALGMASLILGKLHQIRLQRNLGKVGAVMPDINHASTSHVVESLDSENPREQIMKALKPKPGMIKATQSPRPVAKPAANDTKNLPLEHGNGDEGDGERPHNH